AIMTSSTSTSPHSLSRTEILSLASLSFACFAVLANTFQGDGEPLIASLALSGIAFSATYSMIRWLGPNFIKAGLKGVDMSKHHRKEIPECMGAICAIVYLLIIMIFIPFPFYKDIVAATSGGGNKDVVLQPEYVQQGRLLHRFPHNKLASYLSAVISLQSITLLGIGDDLFDIRWRHKFFIPAFASIPILVVYFVDFGVTSIVVPIPLQPYLGELLNVGALYYVYMASVAIFSPNSINILAGINGIEVSQSIVIALLLAINDCLYLLTPYPHPATDSHLFSLYFLLPFLGVSFALLYHNWYPARVFVGDTYCYFAGMVFVAVSILGHFSKTLILLLIPQIINFVYSVPQLFHLVPCPRHRLPRFNARTGLLEPSVTPWTPERQPKPPIAWALKLLGSLRMLRVTLDEEGKFVETTNFTILNLWLVWRGPLREDRLGLEITTMQVVMGLFGLFVRHGLALLIFKEDNWSITRRAENAQGNMRLICPLLFCPSIFKFSDCKELGPKGLFKGRSSAKRVQLPADVRNTTSDQATKRPLVRNKMSRYAQFLDEPPVPEDRLGFEPILKHGHQDLVQSIAFNTYGDRCATGSVDGKIRVFNRHKDGIWRHCDNWTAHGGEIMKLQWLPPSIYPNLLASLGAEGRFKIWAEDPSAAPGRRFSNAKHNIGLVAALTSQPSHPHAQPTPSASHHDSPAAAALETASSTTSTSSVAPKAAFETRNSKAAYRAFSMKYIDDTRHTYLALLSADGKLSVYENETPENMADYMMIDEILVSRASHPAARGEEATYCVEWDPNPEACYSAQRAGVPHDSLAFITACMDCVRIYRSREVITQSMGVAVAGKGFYLAVEIPQEIHRGLVRDVAWAPGNVRGYDVVATACTDSYVRVFRLEATTSSSAESDDSDSDHDEKRSSSSHYPYGGVTRAGKCSAQQQQSGPESQSLLSSQSATAQHNSPAIIPGISSLRGTTSASSTLSNITNTNSPATNTSSQPASLLDLHRDLAKNNPEKRITGLPGQVRHKIKQVSKLDSHGAPVWRVDFDDNGQILGSVGDEGKLMHHRMTPDGRWAKSAELAMVKMKMAAL
ncbi:glycosyl transferase family 4-domain-containing protein, partial [Podospora australis]